MSEDAIGHAAVDGPVLVIGTGLIGTSIALALSRAGVDVALEDADASALQEAVYRGAGSVLIDQEPSIVVVAVPPAVAASQMVDASHRFSTATITDTTSVKGHILDEAIRLGADHVRLVGGHPMAGREISGPSAARADLFDGRLWIMTPTGQEGEQHLARTRRLIATCGAAVEVMDPAEHDMAVAVVSHAPQVLASAMASLLTREPAERIKIAGQGLADTTRIAASDTDLWMQILEANAGPVSGVLTSLVEQIDRAVSSLAPEAETAGLQDVLDQGNRRAFPLAGQAWSSSDSLRGCAGHGQGRARGVGPTVRRSRRSGRELGRRSYRARPRAPEWVGGFVCSAGRA